MDQDPVQSTSMHVDGEMLWSHHDLFISYCRRPPYLAVEVDDLHRNHTRHITADTKIISNAGLRLLHARL
jgi:hypothetical protein